MFQKYTQTTYETCLACSLLQAVDQITPIKINKEIELEVINHSMKFSKEDFVVGHLDYISEKFKINILRVVDNKPFYEYIKKIKTNSKINTITHKIDLGLIDSYLKNTQPIVYIDAYSLFKISHAPHFITVLKKTDEKYEIFDPWYGKTMIIESKVLSDAVSSLRNHLLFCPQLITLSK
ncbi:Peptidase_C39 like family protein [uncultured archaeon]|nr:Peptidase_C39 like family protein [uncultured archaeon]